MFTFPSFRSPDIYPQYIKQGITKWESLQWRVVGIILLLEIAKFIEDTNNTATDWPTLMRNKALYWSSYFIGLILRYLIFKKIKTKKEVYLFVTDCLYLLIIISVFVTISSFPPSNLTPTSVWLGKESVRFFAINLVISTSFFYWYFQALIILLTTMTSTIYLIKVGGDVGIFLPTYLTIVTCVAFYTYSYEKAKRRTFEHEYESLQNEKLWKNMLNEFPEGVLILNFDKTVLYMNSAVNNVLGINSSTKIHNLADINERVNITIENYNQKYFSTEGSESSELDEPETLSFSEFQSKFWAKWENKNYDLMHQHYNVRASYKLEGKLRLFELKFALRKFAGKTVALFTMADITERTLIASLKQNLEFKNRLLASVSHELRTPLNANINFLETALLDEPISPAVVTNCLVPALRSAKCLNLLINDIVDYSQIQAETFKLDFAMQSIVKTVRESLELIEIQAGIKKLNLKLELPTQKWEEDIKTDHARVTQVIMNLLSNALKFTLPGGSITVRVKRESLSIVTVEVEDTGIGISAEDKYKIIKGPDFQHPEGTAYTNNQGYGMGLTISEAIARQLTPYTNLIMSVIEPARAIKFESEPNKGSKFWFNIEDMNSRASLIPAEDKRTIAIPDFRLANMMAPSIQSMCTCPQFLIADDDPFNLSCLQNLLDSLDYSSDSCYNGKEVLKAMAGRILNPCSYNCKPYKMIFLDCNMPVMDGYECMQNLLEVFSQNPSHKCPVVACTAAVQESERKKVLDCGMNDFCSKPINRNMLKNTIEKHLRNSKSLTKAGK